MSVESFVTNTTRNCLRAKRALMVAFCLGTMVTSLSLAAQEISTPDVDKETIDSSGLVWAAKEYGNQLYTYDGKSWKLAPNGLAPYAQAEFRGMSTTADGAVVVAWVVKDEGLAVTRHLGSSSTLLGAEKGDKQPFPNLIQPKSDAKGRVWVGGEFPRIYRTDGKGGLPTLHEFVAEDFRTREKKRGLNSGEYHAIQYEEDGLGRMWIWSNTFGPTINQWGKSDNLDSLASLHSVYIFSENGVEVRDDLGAIKGGDFYCVVRFDDRHMIVSDSENGVYKLDIETWKTESLPGPNPWELRNVHELFVDGSDLYAIDSYGNSLWRWSNGQWSELVPELEQATMEDRPRVWLRVKDGLIVQADSHESWFIPRSGAARTLSWKSGFPAPQLEDIVALKDGTFCILGNEDSTEHRDTRSHFFHCALPDPAKDLSNHRIIAVESDAAWLNAGHIWMIPREDSSALKEWDGKTWLVRPIPNKGRGDVMLNEDDQGMIWVYNYDGSANVFDPVKSQWQGGPTFDACLAATKGRSVHFQRTWRGPYPRYSSDKQQIAYYADTWQALHYFNGSVWRVFKWSDVTGWPGSGDLGPPWFDAKDNLCVCNRMWQGDENGKWTSVPYVAHPLDPYDPPESPKFPVSDLQKAIAARFANTVHADNLGGYWCTGAGNLYHCIGDKWVSVFEPGEITPFNANPAILEADVDPQGNAFLKTFAGETHRYLILAKHPVPRTTITLKQVNDDSFSATFDPHSDGTIQFRWQLDDNEWSTTDSTTITLRHLPNGPHTIQAIAIDDQLGMDASPAVAHCEIKIDEDKQIASLIAQLSSPNYDLRKEAVQILASEPTLSQPALLKAKTNATEDQIWWIEATLQEIESKKAMKANSERIKQLISN